ncbi:exonuclease domain-containing protein [Vibrio coralliirubri]|uniref:3'-5' exonuclease n=1 Tax=Vibrio coralliirubri TaxID=1516159 RepID=UPI002284DDD7|nr:3'-5' exonuclease [Vibrio coralliirubri]MCY9861320.1 exonuclease domain-containing protein [Vibrio coralliirubri]
MSMLTKFNDWQSHIQEADSLKKKAQVLSVAKTLKWGLNEAPSITAVQKRQVEQTLEFIEPLMELDSVMIKEVEVAFDAVSQYLYKNDASSKSSTNHSRNARNELIEASGKSRKLLVVDFEMACDTLAVVDGEIIEFGACVFDTKTNQVIDTFSILTKPQKVGSLSEYCTNLTGITNDEMTNSGLMFKDGAKKFEQLISQHNVEAVCQWGSGDMKRLKTDYAHNQMDIGLIGTLKVIDLRKPFSDTFGGRHRIGLNSALSLIGIKRDSVAHRALPDAIETSKLVMAILSKT